MSTLGAWLECGAAFCAAIAIAGSAPAGPPANALPSIPLVGSSLSIKPSAGPGTQGFQNNVPGSAPLAPTYSTATIAGQAVGAVTLYATRTILDWTSFQVGASATLQFLFPGTTPGAIAGDIVVNRLQGPGAIDIAGVVEGLTSSANPATGGQLWFLAPGGVIFEPGSTVAAGRIVAANAFTTTVNNDTAFLTASGDDAALMRNGGSLIDLRGAVTASGASIDATGAIVITGAVDTGSAGTVTLESTGTISAGGGAVAAGTLTGSSVGGASFNNPANAIAAVSAFTNTGAGNIVLADTAPGAALELGAVVNRAAGSGSGSIAVTQTAGDLVQSAGGRLEASADVSLTVPAGRFNAGTILAGGDITVTAERFTSAPGSALQAAGSLALSAADPNGVVLADSAPSASSASWIDSRSLQAPSVTLTQSDASGVEIADATIGESATGSATRQAFTPRAATATATSAQASSSPPSLTILTPGPVTITGHILPAADATPDLTIGAPSGGAGTPSVIEIINDNVAPPSGSGAVPPGGSIGEGVLSPNGSYSGLQAFGAVSLTAQSYILAGTSAFVAANLNSSAPPSAVNPLLNVPNAGAANLGGGVLIAADLLTLAAGEGILQQNTSGLQSGGGSGLYSGLYVGALTLAAYGQTGPAVFDVYGALAGANGSLISGSAAASSRLITISAVPPPGAVYRINGCPIGEAGACQSDPAGVLAHVVSDLGLPAPAVLGMGGDGDPPVIGPAAVDLWRTGTPASGELPKMSDAQLFGVLTGEVNKTLADYDLDPARCYDVHVLGDDIYDELLKSDVQGVSGATLDLALRKNNTTLRDVIDQGVFEAAQQTAIYCQSRADGAAPRRAIASTDAVIEPARFGAVMARAREALDRVPPKILVAVKHR